MWGISYWVFPVISAVVWLAMIIAMLTDWIADGRPHYPSMASTQTIAYISDVGAQKLKPLFIAGSCVTTIAFDMAFLSERWLRHRGRLVRNESLVEKILAGLSIFFAGVGTAGLILLSIFDTWRHPKLHDIFLCLFIGGYVLSAIFTCAEYQRLGVHAREHRILRTSFYMKLVFIVIAVGLAIAFGVLNTKSDWNNAAIVEWTIAFYFTFYVASYVVDLIPAVHTKNYTSRETAAEMEENDAASSQRELQHNGRNAYF